MVEYKSNIYVATLHKL